MWYALSVNRESEHEMKAECIDGKALAAETRAKVKAGVAELKAKTGIVPGLGVVLVGDDPASRSYVTAKERALEEAGMRSVDVRLPEGTTQAELLGVIARLNADPQVHGILVQLPLPKGLDTEAVIQAIAPEKGTGMLPAVHAAWRVATPTKGRCGHARRTCRGGGPQRHRRASACQSLDAQGTGR